jgi:hypothetical protein
MTTLEKEDIELINKIKDLVEEKYKLEDVHFNDSYNGDDIITITIKRKIGDSKK